VSQLNLLERTLTKQQKIGKALLDLVQNYNTEVPRITNVLPIRPDCFTPKNRVSQRKIGAINAGSLTIKYCGACNGTTPSCHYLGKQQQIYNSSGLPCTVYTCNATNL
jgi:hypothetical protein